MSGERGVRAPYLRSYSSFAVFLCNTWALLVRDSRGPLIHEREQTVCLLDSAMAIEDASGLGHLTNMIIAGAFFIRWTRLCGGQIAGLVRGRLVIR